MEAEEIIKLFARMRAAQLAYFKCGRTYEDLKRSKELEKECDRAIEAYLNPPTPKTQTELPL